MKVSQGNRAGAWMMSEEFKFIGLQPVWLSVPPLNLHS